MQIQLSPDEAAQSRVPGVDGDVEPGDVIDVPDELGKSLLEQVDKWLPVKKAATQKKDG